MIKRCLLLIVALAIAFTLFNCSTRTAKPEEVTLTPEKDSVESKPETIEKEMPKEYVTTFQVGQPQSITIESFQKMSDQNDNSIVPKGAEVTDGPTIVRILELIKSLPDKGEIMKKMGDVPLLEVKLNYEDKVLYFDYYSGSVKTPDTSFYANAPEQQKQLFDLLNSLLN